MRIVIKVGTSTLTHATGKTNLKAMDELVTVLADLRNAGWQVVLVTSGAIGVGVGKLGLPERPRDTAGKQAAATVGQCELMFMYDKMFSQYGHTVGQLLITKEDMDDSQRRANLDQAFQTLFSYGAIPIINENDAVATDEIGIETTIGENDTLSAIVARLVEADWLILLSDIDGLYTADPRSHPDAELIPVVEALTPEILALAGGAGSALGSGGMATKLRAAGIAMEAGVEMIIANGERPEVLYEIFEGKAVGTRFLGKGRAE